MNRSVLRRWDAIAAAQMSEELRRLAAENDALRDALARETERADSAERWAEQWQEAFTQRPAITQCGRLNLPATNTGD